MRTKSQPISLVLLLVCMLTWLGCQNTGRDTMQAGPQQTTAAETEKTIQEKTSSAEPVRERPGQVTQAEETQDPQKIGRLKVDSEVYDFGSIEPLASATGEYTLTNVGEGMLTIQRTHASCGCTKPVLGKKTLKPGESTNMKVTYTASSHPGEVKKTITIYNQPPAQPSKKIVTIAGKIREIVEVEPQNIRFELSDQGPMEYQIKLKSLDNKPFRITGVTASGRDTVTATFDKEAEQTEHTLTVTGNPQKLHKITSGIITIRTTHNKAMNLTTRFSTVRPFAVHPPSRLLRDMKPGETKTGSLKVVSNFREEFEIEGVESQNGYVEVDEISKTQDGYQISYSAKMPEDTSKRYMNDTVTIKIKDRPQAELTVSFYGRMSYSANK